MTAPTPRVPSAESACCCDDADVDTLRAMIARGWPQAAASIAIWGGIGYVACLAWAVAVIGGAL